MFFFKHISSPKSHQEKLGTVNSKGLKTQWQTWNLQLTMLDFNFLFLNRAHEVFWVWFVLSDAWDCHYCLRMVLYCLSVLFNQWCFLLLPTWEREPRPSASFPPALPIPLAFGISYWKWKWKSIGKHWKKRARALFRVQLLTIAMLLLLCKIDCPILFQIYLWIADTHPCLFLIYFCISGVRLPW